MLLVPGLAVRTMSWDEGQARTQAGMKLRFCNHGLQGFKSCSETRARHSLEDKMMGLAGARPSSCVTEVPQASVISNH